MKKINKKDNTCIDCIYSKLDRFGNLNAGKCRYNAPTLEGFPNIILNFD